MSIFRLIVTVSFYACSRLRKMGKTLAKITNQMALNCETYRKFWVSWKDSLIRSGKGHIVGEKLLVEYKDPVVRHIRSIKLTTGWGQVGDWRFKEKCS